MQVTLDYGKTGMTIDIPDENLIGVLGLTPAPPLASPEDAIAAALASPIGTAPLAELAQGKTNACIVICDITRPVPNRLLLPPILRTLEAEGVARDKITLLIATGTHRPNLGDELVALVGPEIARDYRIVNHACKDLASHTFHDHSPNGVPIWLDTRYSAAEIKITVGLIEPHFMAGYSGGRKLVMPGVAALETVQRWHCPRFLESPHATMGVVTDNPVHAEALAIAQRVPPDLIVDVTLDEANRITGVFAGALEAAWLQGVDFAASHVRAHTPHRADIVITSSAGHPLDATFYQTVKGMVGALPALKPGGTILIAAECAEGVGSADFAGTLLALDNLETFVEQISQPDIFITEAWQIEELARAARQAEILFVTSGIPVETLRRCFVTPVKSLENGLKRALQRHGQKATILAIPRGPYVIPTVTR